MHMIIFSCSFIFELREGKGFFVKGRKISDKMTPAFRNFGNHFKMRFRELLKIHKIKLKRNKMDCGESAYKPLASSVNAFLLRHFAHV